MTRQHTVVVTAGLSDYKLTTKLAGLLHNDEVERIYLVRKTPIDNLPDKLFNINPPIAPLRWLPFFEVWRFLSLLYLCLRHRVSAVIGIQLVLHGVQVAVCSTLTGTPCVLGLIGTDVHKYLSSTVTRRLLRPFVRRMNWVTVMGDQSKSTVESLGISSARITKIQNYQDTHKFFKSGTARTWDVLFVGELLARKCIPDLLKALHLCEQKYSLRIVGDGRERKRLERTVDELELSGQVEFVGNVDDVENYMNSSRVLVLPSKLEALPAVAVEAMYCGVPSILTSICDIPTYFTHELGCMIYPQGSVDTLRKYLTKLLNDREYYDYVAGYCDTWTKKHRLDWSIDRQCHCWISILESLQQPLATRPNDVLNNDL